ncbi:PHD finger protein 7 isoform X1 [Prionailurus iriomotensis]
MKICQDKEGNPKEAVFRAWFAGYAFENLGIPKNWGNFSRKTISACIIFVLEYTLRRAYSVPRILSSKLPQRGQSNRGFHGFLPEDIKKEAARASRKRSALCARKRELPSTARRINASETSIFLVAKKGVAFHNFLESTTAGSFCGKHRPTQDIQQGKAGEESCVLCCEDLSQASVENIQSPCCSQTVYHRKCIQKYAHTSAKHFFKCPQCNNREEFPQEMLRMGIHIPDRDAAWELEPGAFSELYQRYQHCDAPICLYEQGRDSFEDEGRWRLILCATCGSHGTHRDCSSLRANSKKWECEECAPSSEATAARPHT